MDARGDRRRPVAAVRADVDPRVRMRAGPARPAAGAAARLGDGRGSIARHAGSGARARPSAAGSGTSPSRRPTELFAAPRTFDLVVCYHVLQRLRRLEGDGAAAPLDRPASARAASACFSGRTARDDSAPGRRLALGCASACPAPTPGQRASRQAGGRSVHPDPHLRPGRDAPGVRSSTRFDRRTWPWSTHEDLDYAVVLAQRKRVDRRRRIDGSERSRRSRRTRAAGGRRQASRMPSIEAFNRAADVYFTSLAGLGAPPRQAVQPGGRDADAADEPRRAAAGAAADARA